MFLYSHKASSSGAKALSDAIGAKRIKHQNSKFLGSPEKVVINWGSSDLPEEVSKCQVINKPEAVGFASNKLKAFQSWKKDEFISIPFFTTSRKEAFEEISQKDKIIVIRHKLQGSSGEGIELLNPEDVRDPEDIPEAPLYVEYKQKKQEFRAHVIKGDVVFIQRKARKLDVPDEEVNWQIRNHDNGFIFAHNEDIKVPDNVLAMVSRSVGILGLDFGAVDFIWNQRNNEYFLLEVNTAPGLEGETLNRYREYFERNDFLFERDIVRFVPKERILDNRNDYPVPD